MFAWNYLFNSQKEIDEQEVIEISPHDSASQCTALMRACLANDVNAVREILTACPETINHQNSEGWTALHIVARNASTWCSRIPVQLLIEAGADLNIQHFKKKTPLHLAVFYVGSDSSLETVEQLLKAGADVNIKDGADRTPLHLSVHISNANYAAIKLLLEYGAHINAQDYDGMTPLHVAMHRYDTLSLNIVELLLQYGGDVHAKTNNNNNALTPLFYLINQPDLSLSLEGMRDSFIKAIQLLLKYGADINARTNANDTFLHCAVRKCTIEEIQFLLQIGADIDINAQNNDGETPLHFAVKYVAVDDSLPIVELLLRCGANLYINTPNRWGNTALDLALGNKVINKRIIALLSQAMFPPHDRDYYKNIILHGMVDKMIRNELKNVSQAIIMQPGSIQYYVQKVTFEIRNGMSLEEIFNGNPELMQYLGIGAPEDILWKLHN